MITLAEAQAAAGRNGIDTRVFELEHDPSGLGYGHISYTGSGRPVRTVSGRIRLRLTDAALESELDAVQTIAHELHHIREGIRTGDVPLDEDAAERAARLAGRYLR
jgi:hypothetical protein